MGKNNQWLINDRRIALLFVAIMTTLSMSLIITSCVSIDKSINRAIPKEIATQAVEIWKEIDISMDSAFVSMGRLYEKGKISDQITDDLIAYGDQMHVHFSTTKETIQLYMWEKNAGDDPATLEKRKHTMLVSLANLITNYYDVYAEMSVIHHKASGFPLPPVQLELSKEVEDYVFTGRTISTQSTNSTSSGE